MAFRALVTALSIALSFDSAAAWSQTVASLLAKHEPAATFTTSAAVVPFSGYKLNYALDAVNKHVTFVVEAETTGWVALGISEAAGMKGADIMMGHVDSSGKAVVGDFHAVSNSRPTKDGCQDWTVHHGQVWADIQGHSRIKSSSGSNLPCGSMAARGKFILARKSQRHAYT